MTAFVESRVIAFASAGRVEREKEHSPCRAEALFYSRRMPSFAESIGREDDEASTGFGDCVAAFFFAWAHKGPDARASRPDALCRRGECPPFARIWDELARTLERRYYRKVKKRRVAVGEPFAPAKLDGRDTAEEALVFLAEIGALRVFFDVAPEGGELHTGNCAADAAFRKTRRVLRSGAPAPLLLTSLKNLGTTGSSKKAGSSSRSGAT